MSRRTFCLKAVSFCPLIVAVEGFLSFYILKCCFDYYSFVLSKISHFELHCFLYLMASSLTNDYVVLLGNEVPVVETPMINC